MDKETYERLKPLADVIRMLKASHAWNSLRAYNHMKKLGEHYGLNNTRQLCILPEGEVISGPSHFSTRPITRTTRLEEGAELQKAAYDEQLTANDMLDIRMLDAQKVIQNKYKRRAIPKYHYTEIRWSNWEDKPSSAYLSGYYKGFVKE